MLFFTGGLSPKMKLTTTDKHKHMYFEYEDEILTSYLFFNVLILFNLLIIYK